MPFFAAMSKWRLLLWSVSPVRSLSGSLSMARITCQPCVHDERRVLWAKSPSTLPEISFPRKGDREEFDREVMKTDREDGAKIDSLHGKASMR